MSSCQTKPAPQATSLTADNFQTFYYRFQERQAGVGLVYSPTDERYFYNAYCIEAKLLQELFAVEYDYLEDALATINAEFGTWELVTFDEADKKNCGSCVAKKPPS